MATPETLRDDDLQTRPQDLTDQEAQAVTFTYESKEEGGDAEIYEKAQFNAIMTLIFGSMPLNTELNDIIHCDQIQDWPHFKKILSDFEKDFNNIMEDKSLIEIVTLLSTYNDYGYDKIPDECLDKNITEKTVKLIGRLNQFISKYCDELIKMFNLGLKNNFKDVPEPMGSHLVKNKNKIGDFVKFLGSLKLKCGNGAKECCKVIKHYGLEIRRDKNICNIVLDKISGILETSFEQEKIEQLKQDFGGLVGLPHIRRYDREENGLKIYKIYDVKEIVDNIDDFPENCYMHFDAHDFILNFYSDKSVKLIRTDTDEEVITDLRWCINGGKFCIVDEKGEIILDNFPLGGMYMQDYIKHINEDLAREIIKSKRNSRRLDLPRLVSIDENSARVLIENSKCERINFQSLTSIDVPTAKIFATFPGKIQISLKADTLTEDVAKELIPIKDRLITSAKLPDEVVEKIEKVEMKVKHGKEVDENLWNLQKQLWKTKKRKNRKGKRGNIEYDWNTDTIKSRGKETEVEKITLNSMKLKGLDLGLTLEEGMWLANLKNKVQYMNKEVTFEKSFINKSFSTTKTLHIGGKMLMTRSDLVEQIHACEDDEVVEKICKWLNY